MRIEQLEYVVAVTRYGSLRKASEHLHISQPALSEAVGKLERELGVPLLERRRTGSRISSQGQELLTGMVEVLDSVRRLKDSAGERGPASRTVRIGTDQSSPGVLLPALRDFGAEHPDAGVEVVRLPPATERGPAGAPFDDPALDLTLVTALDGEAHPDDVVTTELRRGRVVAVLPAGHRLARREALTAEDLREERLVLLRPGHVMHRGAQRILQDTPTRVHHTDGADLGLHMVAAGLGLTLLPDHSVLADPLLTAGTLVSRPVTAPGTGVTLLARHRRHQVPLRVRYLLDHLATHAVRLGRVLPAAVPTAVPA